PDQRLLEFCKGFNFLKREVLVTERHLPLKLDEGVERETASCLQLRTLDLRMGSEAQLRTLTRPPRRQHHAKTRLFQRHCLLGEELVGTGGIKCIAPRRGQLQAGLNARADSRSLAQGRQEVFADVESPTLEERSFAPLRVPGVLCRD